MDKPQQQRSLCAALVAHKGWIYGAATISRRIVSASFCGLTSLNFMVFSASSAATATACRTALWAGTEITHLLTGITSAESPTMKGQIDSRQRFALVSLANRAPDNYYYLETSKRTHNTLCLCDAQVKWTFKSLYFGYFVPSRWGTFN